MIFRRRRDACCSALKNLSSKTCPNCSHKQPTVPSTATNNTGIIRRHTFGGGAIKREFGSSVNNKAALSGPAVYEARQLSSDSDVDDHGENLFVPETRTRLGEKDYEAGSESESKSR